MKVKKKEKQLKQVFNEGKFGNIDLIAYLCKK